MAKRWKNKNKGVKPIRICFDIRTKNYLIASPGASCEWLLNVYFLCDPDAIDYPCLGVKEKISYICNNLTERLLSKVKVGQMESTVKKEKSLLKCKSKLKSM